MIQKPVILHIESATYSSSVALTSGQELIEEITLDDEGTSHAASLAASIEDLLSKLNGTPDAISVSKGPGSYTGLRIGVSLAKGLCFGYGIPLIAVDSLSIIARGLQEMSPDSSGFVPVIDARRMEVYTATFNNHLEMVAPIRAEIVDETTFSSLKLGTCFGGNGAQKIQHLYPGQTFIMRNVLLARNMNRIALAKWGAQEFEDVTEFEPFYLKDFVAGKPSKKILDILGLNQ